MLAAIATGLVIGTSLGMLVAKVGIPSFVVTLAGFLAFQGIVLLLVKEGTNISVRDNTLVAIANRNLTPPWAGRSPSSRSSATRRCSCCVTATGWPAA